MKKENFMDTKKATWEIKLFYSCLEKFVFPDSNVQKYEDNLCVFSRIYGFSKKEFNSQKM